MKILLKRLWQTYRFARLEAKHALNPKTEHVVADFMNAVRRLDDIHHYHRNQVLENKKTITGLQVDNEAHDAEATRAASVAGKLRDLLK